MFEITHQEKNSLARTGILHTEHGDIETPIFMPVGTQATVKTLDNEDLKKINTQIILGNTYHLHLRPGENLIAEFGGLHKFMGWDGPILTDSGGFQVFSLGLQKEAKGQGGLTKIDDDGVTFQSHIDGSTHRFTPEEAIKIQHKIGADIIMAFDECTPDDADEKYTRQALDRTHDWAERCIVEHKKNNCYHGYKQFLFGIIQGAGHKKLREESAKFISDLDFDGIAIGGESVGYNMEATKKILDWVNPIIPKDKPHYTMGVGHSPLDLFEVVERGVDMFDCVSPTRVARNGRLFVHPKIDKKMHINILNTEHRADKNPIDPTCTCFTCQNHSRSYLQHLFKSQEMLAYRLATIHNLHFLLNLMQGMRTAVKEDRFLELKKSWM
ncbi:MAG: tRNA guanosine(34) transglycosylase Tgt [Candidatus Magasanikbacteria bacterium CG_4_10_14_0_2_um_filter_37_12]|uniref:Queuine tRNA-ribosyltransferase n=1 Tax=Candidatus Magasanikbacteria bacterium CG_4_10_14_0_2_um_filter_37_12 TaxID=1974637 RepID=A0A2M7V7N1_9BACT|nr:MAG: tRNA guanosine(34) transglycosylase Tgt [Candidatus Magasanikbacteria bacterium CG_4_10_14_0_2_um_filter_37_12]